MHRCGGHPDCEDPARLCEDLVDDHASFKRLQQEFPGKFKVVRYEDFVVDPQVGKSTEWVIGKNVE